jgi:hypothetical protein
VTLDRDYSVDIELGHVDSAPPQIIGLSPISGPAAQPSFAIWPVEQPVTQLAIGFDEVVYGAAHPVSFLLLRDGGDRVFGSSSCNDGVQGDDSPIMADGIVFDSSALLTTLDLSQQRALPPGLYRLLVCGDYIEDARGNLLDGDSDGQAGGDLRQDLAIQIDSPVLNPNFDDALLDWETEATFPDSWVAGPDSEGFPRSASALVEHIGTDAAGPFALRQCIPVGAGGAVARLRLWIRSTAGSGSPTVEIAALTYPAGSCDEQPSGRISLASVSGDSGGGWLELQRFLDVPDTAAETEVIELEVHIDELAEPGDAVAVDSVAVYPALFACGFESGDTSAWSSSAP